MSGLGGARNLLRHPLRTALSLAGIAVASAMLLDMVMLRGGIEGSFERLLLARGFQYRLSPRGTLPFDTEATIPDVSATVATLRRDPAVVAVSPVLGAAIFGRRRGDDSLVTLFGYGFDPSARALDELLRGRELEPDDTSGMLLGEPAAALLRAGPGDTVTVVGRLDPEAAAPAVERRLVVRGVVRWIYDYRGQPSIGTVLPLMQRLAQAASEDRASLALVKVRDGLATPATTARLRRELPHVEVNGVADLVRHFRERLVYFRQLALILGTVSLLVTVLLVATLLTIGVNERLGEIATLRAIGVSRASVLREVLVEGLVLVAVGGALGAALGLVTARYLDAILTSFPGLPAAFSFFVPRPRPLAVAGLVLLATGALAGLWPAWLAARAPIAATLRAEAT
jgi:putative ABC transport system permease protein